MDRRQFIASLPVAASMRGIVAGRMSSVPEAAPGLTIRFVGMMALVDRRDGSVLVALPGASHSHHLVHRPFLMARAGSPVGRALQMRHTAGVIPSAFDMRLRDSLPDAFVFSCLNQTRLHIGAAQGPVQILATQPAQVDKIVPGARLRPDLEAWSAATLSLSGGTLSDAAAHPDAGRMWSFGSHKQRLTDAVDYSAPEPLTLYLSQRNHRPLSYTAPVGLADELWVVSAAVQTGDVGQPTRLEHGEAASEFLSVGQVAAAECLDATGREPVLSELPCAPGTVASVAGATGRSFPPISPLCYILSIPSGAR